MTDAPEMVGRYRVERRLGQGSMGVVFKGHDPAIDRPVAIKLVRADLLRGRHGEDYLARFRREVQAAGRFAHPNIVAIYDFGDHQGDPYFVMEYVDAPPLDEALPAGGGVPAPMAASVVRQLLAALACAHAAGVVHRDIKPANLLLGPDGQLKIMDFGISRVAASRMTEAGQVMGTPNYMSPEQFRGEGVDQRTDIFAAGVVLYELLTGAPPLAGASMTEVMVKLLHDRVDLVPPDAPLPGPLRQVAACAMALDKEARYASASAMAEALDRAMAGLAAGGAEAAETLYAAPAPVAPAPRPATARLSADTETLALIERSAARRVGPLASRLVKDALKTADSLDGLCQSLAAWIEPEAERAAFLAEMKQRLANASVPPVGAGTIVTALSMSELDEIQRDLIRILGPFAKVLVKRAAGAARTGADLRAALAAHIDDPREREAFLANH